jgi:hypothetical protein
MLDVVLAPHEVRHATLVGVGRDLTAKRQGRRPLIPGSNTFLGHITGALGELTVAKALGIYWDPNIGGNDHGAGDVGRFEVRATTRTPAGLVIRERDRDAAAFVLVTGTPPRLCIRGWCFARDAKRPEYARDGEYFVPAALLDPWDTRPY